MKEETNVLEPYLTIPSMDAMQEELKDKIINRNPSPDLAPPYTTSQSKQNSDLKFINLKSQPKKKQQFFVKYKTTVM